MESWKLQVYVLEWQAFLLEINEILMTENYSAEHTAFSRFLHQKSIIDLNYW